MLRDLADDLLAVVLPGRCPGCGARAEPVCDACAATMRAAPPARALPGIAWSCAALAYEGVARELVARVKYRNERVAVRWLARHVVQACAGSPTAFDVITWVPASTERRATRGVDHGELLAVAVARELHLPVTALLRRSSGPPQTGRPAATRRTGPALRGTRTVTGLTVLIVDDVVTTGGTLVAAARALHACGARTVLAATVARTPRPGAPERDAAYTRHAV
jgi:predicted amidophosphoribosyltransferase